MLLCFLGALAVAAGAEPDINAEQFQRLMTATLSVYADVEFMSENRSDSIKYDLIGRPTDEMRRTFQALYAFRSDGASYLDLYYRGTDAEGVLGRTLYSMLSDRSEEVHHRLGEGRGDIREGSRSRGHLNFPGSPERIVYLWYFQTLEDPASFAYEFQGWEEVDGHRCLRVQLDVLPNLILAEKPYTRFWIDLERGGHPLKVETYRGPNLERLVRDISLARFPTEDGKSVWFPIRGVQDSFLWSDEYRKDPNVRESYAITTSTLRINQGLSDDHFSVLYRAPNMPPALRDLRAKYVADPPLRSDPASVQKRLDEKLREADQQAEGLDASAAAGVGEGWFTSSVLQGVFGLAAVAVLAGAWLLRRKGR